MTTIDRIYYGIDPTGFEHELGQWLIVSIRSVLANTFLKPVVLYSGAEDGNTSRIQAEGAEVILCRSRLKDEILTSIRAGRLPAHAEGALLRYEIPSLRPADPYALYADCDTYFLRSPKIDFATVPVVGAAVTSQRDGQNYYNSGVLIFNTQGFFRQEQDFFHFAASTLGNWTPASVDEAMFNSFFNQTIATLPPEANWRPRFGFREDVDIIHFHGFDLTRTIHMLTRDFRGLSPTILEKTLLPEMALHRSKTLLNAEQYLTMIERTGHFAGTPLQNLAATLNGLTSRERMVESLMLANSQLGLATFHAYEIAHLVDTPAGRKKTVTYTYDASASEATSLMLHPCRNIGAGKITIQHSGSSPLTVLHNEAIRAEINTNGGMTEIYWSGVGLDCHFIIRASKGMMEGKIWLNVVSATDSPVTLFAQVKDGTTLPIQPEVL